jgi:hypothetical protein
MKRRVTLFAVCLAAGISGCGGSGSNPQSATTHPPAASLVVGSTTATVDSSVPTSASSLIIQVLSTADSKPLGWSLSVPTESGFSTPVFAVDKNQNLIMAAMASGGQNTILSAKSTAEVIAILALGTSTVNTGQLIASVDAAPNFPTLVADIQTALQNATSPLASQSVVADLAAVLKDAATNAYQQQSIKPFAVHRESETAAQPLPFQILGGSSSLNTVASVYIDSVSSDGNGVNLKNTLPIAFSASSKDTSGNQIDAGETVPAFDLLSNLLLKLSASPQVTKIAGNGQRFVVTVGTSQTDQANLTKFVTDIILQIISLATDKTLDSAPELESCAAEGAAQIVGAVSKANAAVFAAATTGTEASATLAGSMTAELMSGIVQTAISCAPELSSVAIYQTVATNLATYLVPFLDILQTAFTANDRIGIVAEGIATFYYWNTSVDVNVCLTNGQLATCPSTMSLKVTWTVTPLSQPTGGYWSGTDTLTIANGQFTYTGTLTNQVPGQPCITNRTETGSGTFSTPQPQTPGSPFSFTVSVPITATNTQGSGCANPGTVEAVDSYTAQAVVIQATPMQGGYSLSTNTTYAPQAEYAEAQMTVTASGTITGP